MFTFMKIYCFSRKQH